MKGPLRIPAEWEAHDACWLGFPYLPEEWPGMLPAAQRAIAELCRAIAGPGEEQVRLLVKDDAVEATARSLIGEEPRIEYVRADYGDCWVRDTLPTFGWTDGGRLGGLRFRFNGWGGKFEIPFDDSVGSEVSGLLGAEDVAYDLVLEGGALEFNGAGTVMTTASCVLNPNRNPGLTRAAFEDALRSRVSLDRIVWLERGLADDHTDGHVDMVARFAGPTTVLCMAPEPGLPNVEVLTEIRDALKGQGFDVLELPAAPSISGPDGSPLPPSYCNFYVANRAVIVPTYSSYRDRRALDVLASAFPDHVQVGLPARNLLSGGGSFHCTTQPIPSLR